MEDTVTRIISTIFLTLALCSLLIGRARAETRLTVHEFYGPDGSSLRGDVEAVLRRQEGVTLVSRRDIDNTARNLGVDEFSPEGRKIIARELKLSAWIMGVVKKSAGKLRLTVVMYDGADHNRIGRVVMAGRSAEGLRGTLKRELCRPRRVRLGRPPRRARAHTSDASGCRNAEPRCGGGRSDLHGLRSCPGGVVSLRSTARRAAGHIGRPARLRAGRRGAPEAARVAAHVRRRRQPLPQLHVQRSDHVDAR
jgi:hypothetical protein